MNKTAKTLLWVTPVLLGGYLILRQYLKPSADSKQDVAPPEKKKPLETSSPSSSSSASTENSSVYPLVKGMPKNDTVKSLQSLLNAAGASPALAVDGAFGSKTLAALQSIYGKSQIDSSDDLDSLKNSLSASNEKASNLDWAWKLIDAFMEGNASNLVVKKNIELQEIYKNFQGIWKLKSKKLTLPAHRYNLNDYQLRSALSDGTLRINVANGEFAGEYTTPANIQLSDYLDIE